MDLKTITTPRWSFMGKRPCMNPILWWFSGLIWACLPSYNLRILTNHRGVSIHHVGSVEKWGWATPSGNIRLKPKRVSEIQHGGYNLSMVWSCWLLFWYTWHTWDFHQVFFLMGLNTLVCLTTVSQNSWSFCTKSASCTWSPFIQSDSLYSRWRERWFRYS